TSPKLKLTSLLQFDLTQAIIQNDSKPIVSRSVPRLDLKTSSGPV
ncbi:18906_t:CDS:1, partial [Racocetra persica]